MSHVFPSTLHIELKQCLQNSSELKSNIYLIRTCIWPIEPDCGELSSVSANLTDSYLTQKFALALITYTMTNNLKRTKSKLMKMT